MSPPKHLICHRGDRRKANHELREWDSRPSYSCHSCDSWFASFISRGRRYASAVLAFIAVFVVVAGTAKSAQAAENASEARASEKRLYDSVKLLASDELEGRGVGTAGIDRAADYIAQQFQALGLKTDLFGGGPFQTFKMVVETSQGEPNRAALVGASSREHPAGQIIELKLGEDFNPLAVGGSGKFDLPLVFAGYGITGKQEDYDDYAGIDVEGKAVVVLRHEPQQDNPHSAFNGDRNSLHSYYSRKLSNAYRHGAAAIIFCTDECEIEKSVRRRAKRFETAIDELTAAEAKFKQINEPTLEAIEAHRVETAKLLDEIRDQDEKLRREFDPLVGFREAQSADDAYRIPALFCRRAVLDPIVKAATGSSLAELERQIDEGPKPHSQELTGWRLRGDVTVNRREAQVKNVAALLEGEGPHADETIIVGAHYDHLGLGGEGSLAPGSSEIHNGADDNASGTAALIEIARRLKELPEPLPRRVLFLAFTGEERGLIGSAYYVQHPLVPLKDTVAMLNMDMVGRLNEEQLIVFGFNTATQFDGLLDRLNERHGFKLTKKPGGDGPSDHASFYPQQIPVMHFFTGDHKDYHTPSDDIDKINLPGMRRVAELVGDTVVALAEADERPTYQEVASGRRGGGGDRPYFGSIPSFAGNEPGYKLSGVSAASPAKKAGLKAGDVIVRLGDDKIGNLEDFDGALRKYKAGDKVRVVVKRDDKEMAFEVVLDPPR